MRLVECVPNFSEGRDRKIIDAIAESVRSSGGVKLLDVDAGAGANRTVYTFAGEPEAVLEAAFMAVEKGVELIDMRIHRGAHPRIGACDVCPFVPLAAVSMQDCVELARQLGERIGNILSIPVYLYGEAASSPARRRLSEIRRGGYERLADKISALEWIPDFGPCEFNARSGATAVGARGLLVAFNVNLDTDDAHIARKIAAEIRSSGSGSRRFESLQAIGWFIPEYGCTQVSTNILDIEAAPLADVFDTCRTLAEELGARVTGSEIVGMVPERALADIDRLGLDQIAPFDIQKKVIERALGLPRL